MENPFFIPPRFDDETVVKLHDFIYLVLDAFETHYSWQIARHQRNVRLERLHNSPVSLPEDQAPF